MQLRLAICFLVAAAASSAPAANILSNGGFETGDFTDWSNNSDGTNVLNAVGAPGVGAQEGNFAASLTALVDGVPEVSQLSFPASEGEEWDFQGYMLTETALPEVTSGATFGLLKIVFRDSNGVDLEPASASIGTPLGGANPGVESTPFLNGDSDVNQWIFTQARGVAPANTDSVNFFVLNVDFGNNANHPMWFDGLSAERTIPEPSSLALIALGCGALGFRRFR